MVFIVILLALALERFFDWSHLRRFQWFEHYCHWLSARVERFHPPLRLACFLLPPVLAVGIVEYILSNWIYGLLRFLFDFVILIYCFGPANFWAQTYACLQALTQKDSKLIEARVKEAFPEAVAPSQEVLHQSLTRAIFIESERRVFAVLFWFAILGPMGAILYRLLTLLHQKAMTEMAVLSTRAMEVVEWLPARLLGILFALGGHFVKVLQVWQKYALQGLNTSEALITETGLVALDWPANKPLPEQGEMERQALQLFDRALIMMLVLSAFLILVLP